VVVTDSLVAALACTHIAAAGLDATDPEPLPKGPPPWSRNVLSTAHGAGTSPGSDRRRREVSRENVRRSTAGEMRLNVVDKAVGY
jgi:glyoxylate/hydroxypyruvate reductase